MRCHLAEILSYNLVITFIKDFQAVCKEAEEISRIAKLWIQCMQMFGLVMQFIVAERTGDWVCHLSNVVNLLPFFHAAGYTLYAKSDLYVQKMLNLKSHMTADDFNQFSD
ncbi:hypothetical protein PR048_031640 [Dryococelus australis]|uniref:Uncharacterized protein n=1 Tax=Dryococelus australis TaxID=614101 RepID=A0ABQ9G5V5_9NEOP|nr:hypothetical protein PR048_031640 [Dryococelus australis]